MIESCVVVVVVAKVAIDAAETMALLGCVMKKYRNKLFQLWLLQNADKFQASLYRQSTTSVSLHNELNILFTARIKATTICQIVCICCNVLFCFRCFSFRCVLLFRIICPNFELSGLSFVPRWSFRIYYPQLTIAQVCLFSAIA